MKKFFSIVAFCFVFLLVGCDSSDSSDVDLTKNQKAQSIIAEQEVNSYGEIVHHGVVATELLIKRVKITADAHGYAFVLTDDKKNKTIVSLICDLRTNAAGFTHTIKNDENYVPKGDFEISIMKYRPTVKDIREADDDTDPLFSTANGDTDFFSKLDEIKKLPDDTVLAFVIDKEDSEGYYNGIAWSPLFTVKQLVRATGSDKSQCAGIPITLDSQHVVGLDTKH